MKLDATREAILWMAEGQAEADILAALAEKHPDCDAEQVVADARETLSELWRDADADFELGRLLAARLLILRRACEASDFRSALAAARDLSAMIPNEED